MANSNTDWDDDDDGNPSGNDSNDGKQKTPPGGLREHAKQVAKENAELKAQLEKMQQAQQVERVEKIVKNKGFLPDVAELVPAHLASDDAAVEKWLADREKVLGKIPVEETVEQGFGDDVEDEEMAAYGRVSRVSQASLPATKAADLRAAIAGAKTRAELDEVMRKQGNQYVA